MGITLLQRNPQLSGFYTGSQILARFPVKLALVCTANVARRQMKTDYAGKERTRHNLDIETG